MKALTKKIVLAASVAAAMASVTASACTRVLWETDDHGVFVGRTMDWMEENQPTVDVRPAGIRYRGFESDHALTWESKYASVGLTLYGIGLVDGFNEAGFSANALFLDEESPGKFDETRQQIQNARFVAYLLDSFATVEEALKNIETLQIQQFEHNGMAMKGHYSLQDATGDSAVLEFIDGQWQIYHGKQYDVMTNSPSYAEHLANWEAAKPSDASEIDGNFPVPGNIISSQRFIWNKYMKDQLVEPSSYTNGLAKIDSVTYKIPLDAANRPVNGEMMGYATLYSLAYNLDQQVMQVRYQFGDAFTHFSVDFDKVNDGKFYSIPADQADLFGDITERMIESKGVMGQYRI
ncbi:linear amide C-N hydrolase [Thaumasiovibrio subtropicus]|uniref:linear amide C-N hydrolase n=1 Tax=Thaumasiovibrio subtropicus TaxID=1891207 RepID=UPI000B360A50|nr:linear amide C-N hydrolase [Thaumasiovibrio subtropicus]